MTVENHGSLWQFDPAIQCPYFNLLDETQMTNYFDWIKLCLRLMRDIASRGKKNDLSSYLLQQIRAEQFIKLNLKNWLIIYIFLSINGQNFTSLEHGEILCYFNRCHFLSLSSYTLHLKAIKKKNEENNDFPFGIDKVFAIRIEIFIFSRTTRHRILLSLHTNSQVQTFLYSTFLVSVVSNIVLNNQDNYYTTLNILIFLNSHAYLHKFFRYLIVGHDFSFMVVNFVEEKREIDEMFRNMWWNWEKLEM